MFQNLVFLKNLVFLRGPKIKLGIASITNLQSLKMHINAFNEKLFEIWSCGRGGRSEGGMFICAKENERLELLVSVDN
jgi:hypothetical protein